MTHIGRLGAGDAEELLDAAGRSRSLLEPWVYLPETLVEIREILSAPPSVRIGYGVRTTGGDLAGVVNINAIIGGAFLNGFLGYYALRPYDGQGLMRDGLAQVITRAFTAHELHRLEANVQPANVRSASLVAGLGFRFEGHSPRYLRIGGEWRDHDRYALTAEEWQMPRTLVDPS
ncbi:MAG: phosphinothricin acetyltransferase [Actinobacteria bacterium HGW-Actinobacteria-7]|nr:MAG: phosphinothricin acetyltransferase [Actinobacteria bacterium HGW-Actinobacteria-7]